MERPYILIIEDDPDDRQLFIDEFRRHHADITMQSAESGDQALIYLRDCLPHELPILIIVDYQMPGLYGPAFLQAIQHNPRYGKIGKVVWSTSHSKESADRCLESGADKYFIKPCNLAGLDEIIEYIAQMLPARVAP